MVREGCGSGEGACWVGCVGCVEVCVEKGDVERHRSSVIGGNRYLGFPRISHEHFDQL